MFYEFYKGAIKAYSFWRRPLGIREIRRSFYFILGIQAGEVLDLFNIIVLGFVSLLTDISSEMVYPLLPIFLTTTFGASPAIVGVIEGIAECTASLLKVFSGYWGDKTKKKKN